MELKEKNQQEINDEYDSVRKKINSNLRFFIFFFFYKNLFEKASRKKEDQQSPPRELKNSINLYKKMILKLFFFKKILMGDLIECFYCKQILLLVWVFS